MKDMDVHFRHEQPLLDGRSHSQQSSHRQLLRTSWACVHIQKSLDPVGVCMCCQCSALAFTLYTHSDRFPQPLWVRVCVVSVLHLLLPCVPSHQRHCLCCTRTLHVKCAVIAMLAFTLCSYTLTSGTACAARGPCM
jgi:hypothetical protein